VCAAYSSLTIESENTRAIFEGQGGFIEGKTGAGTGTGGLADDTMAISLVRSAVDVIYRLAIGEAEASKGRGLLGEIGMGEKPGTGRMGPPVEGFNSDGITQVLDAIGANLSVTTDDKGSLYRRVGAARFLATLVDQFLTSRRSSLGLKVLLASYEQLLGVALAGMGDFEVLVRGHSGTVLRYLVPLAPLAREQIRKNKMKKTENKISVLIHHILSKAVLPRLYMYTFICINT
jgi:hypothetical protein